jgi:predicted dehydrogenase
MNSSHPTRRALLTAGGAALLAGAAKADEPAPGKVYKIGVVSASIGGKPQKTNGHTWHFAQYLHPTINLDIIKKYLDPGSATYFQKVVRNPKYTFDQLQFPDTKITHYYDADPESAARFPEAFPGVKVAKSLEEMAKEVDAVWLGDASGRGEDHFDLVAPGLAKGLPTFCDKPIGGSVEGTRKILEFAKKHNAPIMSSSLFRHEWGMEAALRMRDTNEFGPLQYVMASLGGGYSPESWAVYGQHPVWTVMTLCGPGVHAVSAYPYKAACHALITYKDKMPAEVWYGRPDVAKDYCSTSVHFTQKTFTFTPAIEGDFWYGHHYEMFRMAWTFREMVKSRKEPIPHREILEVTAVIHAGIKSMAEKSRLVELAEVGA